MTLAVSGQTEGNLIEAKEIAQRLLEPDSLGILSRKPLMDNELPEVSDIDLLAIWDKPEEYVERRTVMGSEGRVFVESSCGYPWERCSIPGPLQGTVCSLTSSWNRMRSG